MVVEGRLEGLKGAEGSQRAVYLSRRPVCFGHQSHYRQRASAHLARVFAYFGLHIYSANAMLKDTGLNKF
jgi:hypothetical protein